MSPFSIGGFDLTTILWTQCGGGYFPGRGVLGGLFGGFWMSPGFPASRTGDSGARSGGAPPGPRGDALGFGGCTRPVEPDILSGPPLDVAARHAGAVGQTYAARRRHQSREKQYLLTFIILTFKISIIFCFFSLFCLSIHSLSIYCYSSSYCPLGCVYPYGQRGLEIGEKPSQNGPKNPPKNPGFLGLGAL